MKYIDATIFINSILPKEGRTKYVRLIEAVVSARGKFATSVLTIDEVTYKGRIGAITSPEVLEAVRRFGDQELVLKASANIGQLAALEGKGVHEMLTALFKGLPFSDEKLRFLSSGREKPEGGTEEPEI